MKKIFYLFLLCLLIVSCSSKMYQYKVEMVHPIYSNTLNYDDDTMSISYALKPKYIEFTLYNKSEDGIKINWDEVSFSINGKAFRTIHKETGIMKVNDVQPPTTLPPKSNLHDFLIPTQNISYNRPSTVFTENNIKDMFPIFDYGMKDKKKEIMSLKGVRITIFMPFYIRGQYVSKYYDLDIKDVIAVSDKKKLK